LGRIEERGGDLARGRVGEWNSQVLLLETAIREMKK